MDEVLLEDDDLYVALPAKAVTAGHMVIVPKGEYIIFEEVPDAIVSKIFQIANKVSGILFEVLDIQGTNYLVQNGEAAGQKIDVFSLNIIPRSEDDDLTLKWNPKDVGKQRLDEVLKQFDAVDQQRKSQEYLQAQKDEYEKRAKSDESEDLTQHEKDHLVRHLDRNP